MIRLEDRHDNYSTTTSIFAISMDNIFYFNILIDDDYDRNYKIEIKRIIYKRILDRNQNIEEYMSKDIEQDVKLKSCTMSFNCTEWTTFDYHS